jgi:thiamine-phosphate pyrophosphorylase
LLPPERKPILCYVTDRRAFAAADIPSGEFGNRSAIGDAPTGLNQDEEIDRLARDRAFSGKPLHLLRARIRNAAAAGVGWIQIREKDLETRALLELVRVAVADTQASGARIFVNDRLDIALAASAGGIHLGEKSMPLKDVAEWRRASGRTNFRIGMSCHSLEAASAAERDGADYVIFGPVFATPSKAAFGAPQGIAALREVCATVRIPVLAIGGVTVDHVGACMAAGAAGVAAIRLFQEIGGVEQTSASLGLKFPRC